MQLATVARELSSDAAVLRERAALGENNPDLRPDHFTHHVPCERVEPALLVRANEGEDALSRPLDPLGKMLERELDLLVGLAYLGLLLRDERAAHRYAFPTCSSSSSARMKAAAISLSSCTLDLTRRNVLIDSSSRSVSNSNSRSRFHSARTCSMLRSALRHGGRWTGSYSPAPNARFSIKRWAWNSIRFATNLLGSGSA